MLQQIGDKKRTSHSLTAKRRRAELVQKSVRKKDNGIFLSTKSEKAGGGGEGTKEKTRNSIPDKGESNLNRAETGQKPLLANKKGEGPRAISPWERTPSLSFLLLEGAGV